MADFDAIVIGSGMSGGWAAKELTERGFKVLILERGNEIDPARDYSDHLAPWERPNLDRIPEDEVAQHYPIQKAGVGYAVLETTKQFWVKDDEHPYETPEGKPFQWLRGYHTAGKSIMWSRQSYRLGPQDFESNKNDGHGIDWPIRYNDLRPWYDYVERFAGIAGNRDGLTQLPDGQFQPAFGMTAGEQVLKRGVERTFPGRKVISARIAHLTAPTEEQTALGRGACQSRNYCHRGCSFGAYFSSISATLPAARRTNNLTIVHNAVVSKLEYDPATKRISRVHVVDAVTKEERTYSSRIVFLNAGTIATTLIMLRSTSDTFQNGLANRSGQLGKNLIDHFGQATAAGIVPGLDDRYHAGRAPGGIYIPRYINLPGHEQDDTFVRGFGFQGQARRRGWDGDKAGVGADFKTANRTPGPWFAYISAFGEMLPNPNNKITLHATKKDQWGMATPIIDCTLGPNEAAMMQRAGKDAKAMLEAAGIYVVMSTENLPAEAILSEPGNKIHEMGTARMGADPMQSVFNGKSQAHDIDNLFCSDGATMPSGACQNPSLTYMALSARAANYAADLMRDGVL